MGAGLRLSPPGKGNMSGETCVASPDEPAPVLPPGVFDGVLKQKLPEWLTRDAASLRAHPAFQDALRRYAESMTSLLENAPDRVRVISEEALLLVGVALSAMHLSRDPADSRSGATLTRAKTFAVRTGLASPNRVAAYVGLTKRLGYWRQAEAPEDRRIRLLEPTEKGSGLSQIYTRMTLETVQMLSDGADYLAVLQTDPDFQGRIAVEAVNQYLGGVRVPPAVEDASYFMDQIAGHQVMLKLWLAFVKQSNGSRVISYPYERLALSFTVSRAHIRRMIEAGRERGLFIIHAPGGRAIEILPKFVDLQETVASLVFAQVKKGADIAAAAAGRSRIRWDAVGEGEACR